MTKTEIKQVKEKLLTDDSFVMEELEKLRIFYRLKSEIRYGLTREEEIDTESVAEHIYGMFILSRYFLPLEDPDGSWNRLKIDEMILYHDIDEIETGDTIGYLKTAEHNSVDIEATKRVIQTVPTSLHTHISAITDEYFAQGTPEARFVKAIDKLEPVFHLYCEAGKKTCNHHKTTFEDGMGIKKPILEKFTYMNRFLIVASEEMDRQGFFTSTA